MTRNGLLRRMFLPALLAAVAFAPMPASAGAQAEERLAHSVVMGLAKEIADAPMPADYANRDELQPWLREMSRRIGDRIPNEGERRDFLATVHYQATRAGLEPELVLGVIHHESNFRKFAISSADARGYMQVMPFWTGLIGSRDHNLFNLRTNLRYGCVILRYYLVDREAGDLYRALGRYNGSLGRSEYPNAVLSASNRYRIVQPVAATTANVAGSPTSLPR